MVNEIDPEILTKICFETYEKYLEKKNNLAKKEWTNVAAIVMYELENDVKSNFFKRNFSVQKKSTLVFVNSGTI
jgi:hypothetical protein